MLTVEDTAFSIAVVRADEARRPVAERLFHDPYASMFAEAGTKVGTAVV
jgi:O-methyltransferase involved in polyketide biosynthesis